MRALSAPLGYFASPSRLRGPEKPRVRDLSVAAQGPTPLADRRSLRHPARTSALPRVFRDNYGVLVRADAADPSARTHTRARTQLQRRSREVTVAKTAYFLARLKQCRHFSYDFAADRCVQVWRSVQSPTEFQERLRRAVVAVESLTAIGGGKRGEQIRRALLASAKQACEGYRAACLSTSPEQFVDRIGFAASKAKRATGSLVLLVQLDYLAIEQTRELIIELRALERILTASRNTAKRRQARRRASTDRRRQRPPANT